MLTVNDLTKTKRVITPARIVEMTGSYDHSAMRRWIGDDAALIRVSMKSSTAFDGESRTNEGDPSPC
jgi:hypothetical protein